MVRTTQILHPPRTSAPARRAATLLLLRDAPQGLEVLMTRRSQSASFVPGAYVFPGGAVDTQDAASHALATRRASQSDEQLTDAIAAIRESFEELGVLLACHADGSAVSAAELALLQRDQDLFSQCQRLGLQLDAAALRVLAHWVTDRDLARRFDVPFLVASMPAGQTPVADESEQFEPVWVRPADALARHSEGNFFLIFPTIRTLEWLGQHGTVESVLQACRADGEPLWHSCPRAAWLGGRQVRYMEHELPFAELELVCPDGQILHALDWQHATPVPLLKNVQRLTAPNPGAMTGPGTNSYLVGDPATGYLAIDPGPADADHLQTLWRAAGGDIRMIVCTHSHPDHAPGARPLQALCAGHPPILGLPSAATARANSTFAPDRVLQNQELLRLAAPALEGDITHTLEVVYTPGHAANHLCLLLREDGLLFSGDHILSGSTTVIDPPDGDMSAYLESLDALQQQCTAQGVDFILPAHGYAIGGAGGGAVQAIARLKAHRLRREAKILQVMQSQPQGTPDDWLAQVYDDVPPRMWPVAKRSLLAHLARIEGGLSAVEN